jgi:hypothetical protein
LHSLTSSCSFHPQISAPYISTLSTSSRTASFSSRTHPPLSLSYSPNTSNYLDRFPHYLSHLRIVRGSLVEGVAQAPELAHSLYLAFLPLPLFLPHILFQVPHYFFHLSLTLWHNHHVIRKRQAPNNDTP